MKTCRRAFGILMILLLVLSLSACKEVLHTGLTENEANQVLSTLIQYNVPAEKKRGKDGTSEILVDRDQFSYAVDLLNSFGLPKQQYTDMTEILGKSGLVSSPNKEWAQLNYARSQEIAAMVATIPGVINAKVQIANPRQTNPFDPKVPPNVAVLALVAKDKVTPELVPQIKKLIENSVDDVSYDNVGVVISPVAPPAPLPKDNVSFAGMTLARSSLADAYRLIGIVGGLAIAFGAALGFAIHWFLKRSTRKGKQS